MIKRIIATILAGLVLCSALAGCNVKKTEAVTLGFMEENAAEKAAYEFFLKNSKAASDDKYPENFEEKSFPSLSNMLLELNAGKIDFIKAPLSVGTYLAAKDSNLSYVIADSFDSHHMATRPEDRELCNELTAAIDVLKEDGSLDILVRDYITDSAGDPEVNMLGKKSDKTYVVGITGDLPPMDYVSADATPAGFNVALLNAISEKIDCNFEIVQVSAGARTTALAAKKIDIIFWNSCFMTEGFEQTVDDLLLTSSYFEDKNSYVTKDFPVEKIKEIYAIQ